MERILVRVPLGEEIFSGNFSQAYGTSTNPASWEIWEVMIDSESWFPAITAGGYDMLTTCHLYTGSMMSTSVSEDIRGHETSSWLVSQCPSWVVALRIYLFIYINQEPHPMKLMLHFLVWPNNDFINMCSQFVFNTQFFKLIYYPCFPIIILSHPLKPLCDLRYQSQDAHLLMTHSIVSKM